MNQAVTTNYYMGCGGIIEGTEPEKKAALKVYEAKGNVVAQPKCDGDWTSIHSGKDLTVLTRNDNVIQNHGLPSFPEGTLVVGERGSGQQEAVRRRQKLGHDFVDVFDILFYNHNWLGDLPFSERQKRLRYWHSKMWDKTQKFFNVLPCWTDNFDIRYEKQPEGLVLKTLDGLYVPGTRPDEWVKAKKEYDYDMVIMGFELSTALTKTAVAYCKNITVGQYVNGTLTAMGKVGSMDDKISQNIAGNFQAYKGKVVVIKGFGRFDSGAVRSPSLVRFRTDKNAIDCIWKGK
tara:strand:+ start:996 stop:1865 length:870 start_codon:yes stop_codon:yes gene_type:complete